MKQSSDKSNQEAVHTNTPYDGLTPLDESVPVNYAYGTNNDTKHDEKEK